MQYIDPKQMERVPDASPPFDLDRDWIVIVGQGPHSPESDLDRRKGYPCPTCGFRKDERIVRRRAIVQDGVMIAKERRGLVVCSDCCQGSLDGYVRYPGLGVNEAPDVEWLKQYEEEEAKRGPEPTKYVAVGMRERVLTRREKRAGKGRVKV